MGSKTAAEVRALEVAKSPNPEPLDLFDGQSDGPVWKAEHWPAPVASFALDVAERTGCDPAIPCSAIIASVCALADDRVRLQVKKNDDTWREGPRLWLMVSADPSAKKTPGQKEPMAEVLRIQGEWSEQYRREREAYELAEEVYKRQRRDYVKQKATGNPAEIPEEPKRPVWKRAVVKDATVEALASIAEHNPQGLLSYQDELSGWFGSMDAYRGKGVSKDRGDWLESYNGGPHIIDRAGKGHRHIDNWSVSIVGAIQPEKLRAIAKGLNDDGLIQRFMVMPARPAGRGIDRCPGSRQSWRNTLGRIARLEGPKVVRLSPGAQEVMDEARGTLHMLGLNPIHTKGLQTAIQKTEGQLARLMLIFHLVETCSIEPVSEETARRAANAMLDYFVPCSMWFHQNFLATDKLHASMRKVAGWILAEGHTSVTRRQVYRAQRELQGEAGNHMLQQIMEKLDLAGWVEVTKRNKNNQPNAWSVNPRIHERFTHEAEAERKRRREELQRIEECTAQRRSEIAQEESPP